MTTGVIIQARLGSSRLPGKVLKRLCGRTVLAWVVERCLAIDGVDDVCCAVPEGTTDDPVAEEAERVGARVFRGNETDVLDRYHQAARTFGYDVVLRVTSDCPLIDPVVCAEVLALRHSAGADYACNNLPPSWPHGLDCEAVTFDWLARAVAEAERPFEREHVTPYIRTHPHAIVVNLPMPGTGAPEQRWTLDTAADFSFLSQLASRIPTGPAGWGYRVVLALVRKDPGLFAINAGQDRYEGIKRSMGLWDSVGLV